MADIIADTTLQPGGAPGLSVELSPDWDHYFGMLGGYLLAVGTRAALSVAPMGLSLRSVHAVYLGAGHAGHARANAEVLHAGRTMTVVRAHLQQGDRRILDVTAVLSTRRPEAPRFECLPAPVAERRFESSHRSHSPTDALWTRSLEGRVCVDDLDAWEATGQPEAREWIRFRSGDGFRSDPGLASDLACLVIGDLLGFVAARKRFDTRRYIAPTVDIAVFFHGAQDPGGLYLCDAWGRAAGDGAVSAETTVWTSGGALMATAVQTMLFRER